MHTMIPVNEMIPVNQDVSSTINQDVSSTINVNLITMIIFILCAFVNVIFSKVVCIYFTMPYDCVINNDLYSTFDTTTNLGLYCILIYYFNNLHTLVKYKLRVNVFLIIISLISNYVFSYVSSIESLRSSVQLHDTKNSNVHANYIYIAILIFQFFFTGYTIVKEPFRPLDIFLRFAFVLWFVIWIYVVYDSSIHLHHTFFSLLICVINYQNNLPSRIVFFTSFGIFIEGFVNYKYEGLITQNIEIEPEIITVEKIVYKYQAGCGCEYECDYFLETEFINYVCNNVCN